MRTHGHIPLLLPRGTAVDGAKNHACLSTVNTSVVLLGHYASEHVLLCSSSPSEDGCPCCVDLKEAYQGNRVTPRWPGVHPQGGWPQWEIEQTMARCRNW